VLLRSKNPPTGTMAPNVIPAMAYTTMTLP
jgi:hypothetical protein